MLTLRFGPATIRVQADEQFSDVLDSLGNWLDREQGAEAATPDVCVTFSRGRSQTRRSWWDHKAWDATPDRDHESGVLRWNLFLHESSVMKATRVVPDEMIRWAHAHRFGRTEMLANASLYRHILPAAQEALRSHKATLVHASAVTSPDGRAVLLLGRGGAGKTSASTQMYIRSPEQWRYMSDDLAVLQADGTLFRSPVPLNIFPYNTERFPELWNLLASEMSWIDKTNWKIRRRVFGASGTARRRSPFREFLGPPTARVSHVIELQRGDVASPVAATVDSTEIAREARDVLAHELRSGFDGITRLLSLPGSEDVPLPSARAALDAAEEVIRDAFHGARLHRVILPWLAPPDTVGETIRRIVSTDA